MTPCIKNILLMTPCIQFNKLSHNCAGWSLYGVVGEEDVFMNDDDFTGVDDDDSGYNRDSYNKETKM